MIVRAALAADVAAVTAIYAHYVLHGTGTFEETPPTEAQMADRIAAVEGHGLPWGVAEEEGRIVAFAYASPFRSRAAYRYTAEDSVYVAPDAQGRGLGKAVLGWIVAECEARGVRQLIAVIGDSANAGSIGVHRTLGFGQAGLLPAAGFKAGRWVDVVLMTLALNGGGHGQPQGEGLIL
jgi:L-amino acid N-acyltransferase YncA